MNNGLTIKDATERWVHEMNAIPQGHDREADEHRRRGHPRGD